MGVKKKPEYKIPKSQSYLEQLLQLKYVAIGLYNSKAPSESWSHLLATKKALSVNITDLYSNKRKFTYPLEETSTTTSGLSAKKKNKISSEAFEGNTFLESSSSELINFNDPDENSEQIVKETCNSISSLEINNVTSSNLKLQDYSECKSNIFHHRISIPNHIPGVDVEDPLRRSNKLTKIMGDHLLEKVIPVGKRFQADIPNYIGPPSDEYMLESSKWLGDKIWPNKGGNMCTKYLKQIGQGRPSYKCSCDYPNSTECINYHLHDERCRLMAETGDAFFSWGFNQMGELVSDSWTLVEQKTLNNLFKRKTTLSK